MSPRTKQPAILKSKISKRVTADSNQLKIKIESYKSLELIINQRF